MPRPNSKATLLQAASDNYNKLLQYLEESPTAELETEFPPGYLNRNVRDVLAHLHHWHTMVMEWHRVAMSGGKPDIPAKGYTWKTTPALNRAIWQKYNEVPIAEVKQKLATSNEQIIAIIEQHTDGELFTKKYYKWTGSTSMGAYFISATSSHYDWALKLIRRVRRELANPIAI